MPAADWKTMRYEHHDLFGQKTPRDPNKPRPNPYNYYKGNVTIDGKLFRDLGLRKKGLLGSVNAQRPSIKINFDKFGEHCRIDFVSPTAALVKSRFTNSRTPDANAFFDRTNRLPALQLGEAKDGFAFKPFVLRLLLQ